LPPSPYFIYANAIVSVGGAVYVDYQNVTNRSTASIASFRVDNGTPLWKRSDPLNGAGLISDGDQVILVGLGGLDALRASDGTILWQATYDTPAASYVLQADTLYGVSTAIGDGANPYSAIGYFAVNLADGKLLWSMTIPTFIIPGIANQTLSGPVVSGNAMYFGTANGVVIAVRASDGVMLWKTSTISTPVSDPSSGINPVTPVAALNGSLYVNGEYGLLRIRASDGAIEDTELNASLSRVQVDGAHNVYVLSAPQIAPGATAPTAIALTVFDSDGAILGQMTNNNPSYSILAYAPNVFYFYAPARGELAIRLSDGVNLWGQDLDGEAGDLAASQGRLFTGI
jgi:outer membrane protein assembly factor BamB